MATTPARIESLSTGTTACFELRSLRLDHAPPFCGSTTPPEVPAITVTVSVPPTVAASASVVVPALLPAWFWYPPATVPYESLTTLGLAPEPLGWRPPPLTVPPRTPVVIELLGSPAITLMPVPLTVPFTLPVA